MSIILDNLRCAMAESGVDAYLIFNTDPHNSEYISEDQWVVRALSGFTGDNAIAIVTQDFAGVWTDSRFYISGEIEMRGSGFQLMKKTTNNDPGFMVFLRDRLKSGNVVAFDGNLLSHNDYISLKKKLEPAGIIVRNNVDLTDRFWKDRPGVRYSDIYILDDKYSGKSVACKLQDLYSSIRSDKGQHLVLTRLDDIAWLLNLRAADIDYCPLLKSFMLISVSDSTERAVLFVHGGRLDGTISQYLAGNGIVVREYGDIYAELGRLDGGIVFIDCTSANSRIVSSVSKSCKVQDRKSPVQFAKAIKNETEIANIQRALVIDGVAMERFLYRMHQLEESGYRDVTELSLAKILLSERQKGDTFISESFECISAFNEHAAMPHYAPNPDSDLAIRPDGVYLVDSGGQYMLGTTDITRTLPTGRFSDQFAIDYTLVLMGNLELSMAVFPEGTTGHQLDALARMHMWRHGRKFGHGTGHGVGYCLNCHEGPQSFSPVHNPVTLKPGMVITDEPGIYIENEYGIRTENMLRVVKSEYDGFLKFDVMTLCHIDTRPVVKSLMTQPQIDFLNDYNTRVFSEISPYLNDGEKAYLREMTKPI